MRTAVIFTTLLLTMIACQDFFDDKQLQGIFDKFWGKDRRGKRPDFPPRNDTNGSRPHPPRPRPPFPPRNDTNGTRPRPPFPPRNDTNGTRPHPPGPRPPRNDTNGTRPHPPGPRPPFPPKNETNDTAFSFKMGQRRRGNSEEGEQEERPQRRGGRHQRREEGDNENEQEERPQRRGGRRGNRQNLKRDEE